MSTAEITAYLYGAHLAEQEESLVKAQTSSQARLGLVGGADVGGARKKLGSDMFGYWVRRGYDEAV
jgi:hypothetical protein